MYRLMIIMVFLSEEIKNDQSIVSLFLGVLCINSAENIMTLIKTKGFLAYPSGFFMFHFCSWQ